MAETPEYFIVRRNADGTARYYWQPSKRWAAVLRARGLRSCRPLSDNRDIAKLECEEFTGEMKSLLGGAEPIKAAAGGVANVVAPSPAALPAEVTGVYVVGFREGPVKVGHGHDPRRRMSELQVSHARDLQLWLYLRLPEISGRRIEREAHKSLAAHRKRGEWFAVGPGAAVKAVLAAYAVRTKA